LKVESADVARRLAANVDARITELETKLQDCMAERKDLEIRLEVVQESGIIVVEMLQYCIRIEGLGYILILFLSCAYRFLSV